MSKTMSRVLVVDDDAGTRSLVTRLLTQHLNAQVSEAANGLEALDLLSREAFSAVLLDIRMPTFDGVETLQVIRRSPRLQRLPVCMMTVDRKEASVRLAIALGVTDFVLKPVNAQALVRRLRRVLATARRFGGPPRQLSLDATTRVLIVDGHVAFRRFFVHQVSTRCGVTACETGVDALRRSLPYVPDAVFVGDSLGLIARDMLVSKLRSTHRGDRMLTVAVVDGHADGQPPPDGCDTHLSRTLDPDVFWPEFVRAVGLEDLTLSARSPLVLNVVGAVREACARVLGLEVSCAPAVVDDQRRDWCCARLEVSALAVRVAIETAMPVGVLREALGKVRGAASPCTVGDHEIADTLRELVVEAADRLMVFLRERGLSPHTSPPTVTTVERVGAPLMARPASVCTGLLAGSAVLGEVTVCQVV